MDEEENSILKSIRSSVISDSTDTSFDLDLKMHINAALFILHDLGIGPDDGFRVSSDAETWTDFIGDTKLLEAVKTFVYMKVKIIFDPPASGFVMDAYLKEIDQYQWRLCNAVET